MKLHPVDLDAFQPQIFRLFQKKTPLLTAGSREGCNTMTIGWGQLGTLWNKPVCTVYVRPERFTHQFVESSPYFTVSILPDEYKNALSFCGTKSGRDGDKFKASGLTPAFTEEGAPYPAEAELVIVCRKLYTQKLQEDGTADHATVGPYYGKMGDWHQAYTGEVVGIYESEKNN